jgi:hypothetical protein
MNGGFLLQFPVGEVICGAGKKCLAVDAQAGTEQLSPALAGRNREADVLSRRLALESQVVDF